MIKPEMFLQVIREQVTEVVRGALKDVITFGTIPATYGGVGQPTILFDGETVASVKTYPYLSSYAPTVGHRVALVRAGHTWLILGRVL